MDPFSPKLVALKASLAGCHPNRETPRSIREVGFEIGPLEPFLPPVPFAGLVPQVQGEAVAPSAGR
jgi:hypothetical protein